MERRNAVAPRAVFLPAASAKPPIAQKPSGELPAAWQDVPAQGQSITGDRWWTLYGDPALERLIEDGLANNLDLVIATERIEEARAQLRVIDSTRLPAVDATAGADRTRS